MSALVGAVTCVHADDLVKHGGKTIPGLNIRRQRTRIGPLLIIDHERLAHPEHSVTIKVWIVGREHFGDDRAEPRRRCDHMQMRRPPGRPTGGAQQITHRPVIGHRIGHWLHGGECVTAVGADTHGCAQIVARLIRVLIGVQAIRGRLPDLNGGTCDGCPILGKHASRYDHVLPRVVFDQIAANRQRWCTKDMKRAEHTRLGSAD
jgi:hypothetical protein